MPRGPFHTCYHLYTYHDLLSKLPRSTPVWPRSSVGRVSEDLIRRSWVQIPPGSRFSFSGGNPPKTPFKGALAYRQYCLLPAHHNTLKYQLITLYTGAARSFPYMLSGTPHVRPKSGILRPLLSEKMSIPSLFSATCPPPPHPPALQNPVSFISSQLRLNTASSRRHYQVT